MNEKQIRRKSRIRMAMEWVTKAIRETDNATSALLLLEENRTKGEDQVQLSPNVWMMVTEMSVRLLPILDNWVGSCRITDRDGVLYLANRFFREVLANCADKERIVEALVEAEMRSERQEMSFYTYVATNWTNLEGDEESE